MPKFFLKSKKMYVLYIWLSVTYGCHFQVWQNHINCLLEELVTQLFPVSISPSAEKIQLHSPAVEETHSGKHVFLILLFQRKCLTNAFIIHVILAAFIVSIIWCSLELQSSHGSRKLLYSSFRKCEYCLLIICMCSNNTLFFHFREKLVIIISLESSSHRITHRQPIFWISQENLAGITMCKSACHISKLNWIVVNPFSLFSHFGNNREDAA